MAMTNEQLHDLAPGYALDALDEEDRRAFETHLGECERCREELVSLGDTAGALALAAEGPSPPSALRERVLEAARAQPSNVVPLHRRRRVIAVAGIAAAAAAALAIGLWTALDGGPNSTRIALRGTEGHLVVRPSGEATMEISRVPRAPTGKDYEIWVIRGGVPERAGTFDGGGKVVITLHRPVSKGATVAVTLERDGGVEAPTGDVLFSASV
jgi:anti-sigma-K factor RskA